MKPTIVFALLLTIAGCSPQTQFNGAPREGVDTDGDGPPDDWEDGTVTVDLPSGEKRTLDIKGMGGSSTHKDIYVWMSWMNGDASHPQGHQPDGDALKRIVAAFDTAPVHGNPDGRSGIRLHIIRASRGVPHQTYLGTTNSAGEYQWAKFEEIRKAEFPESLRDRFHFALIAHRLGGITNVTGASRGTPGSEFVVSLGDRWNKDQLDGTFMHELGHNLGLQHGGNDELARKPNYLSVMNYSFQFDGLWIDGEAPNFDYSQFALAPLDETRLDRQSGLTTDPMQSRYGTQIYCTCSQKSTFVASIGSPIDWDCSQSASGNVPRFVDRDIDRSCDRSKFSGAEDWSRVQLKYSRLAPVFTTAIRELTETIAREILIPPVRRVVARLENNAVRVSWQRIGLDMVLSYRVDRTDDDRGATTRYTEEASFLDREVVEGRSYSYTVSAILADRGGEIPLDVPVQNQLLFLMQIAPLRARVFSAQTTNTPPLPGAFYQTAPSSPVTIRVVLR